MRHFKDISKVVELIDNREAELFRSNERKRNLEVVDRKESYRNTGADFYLFLEGNGIEYVLLVFKEAPSMRLYPSSKYIIDQVNYTDGINVKTETNSGERIRHVSIGFKDVCSECGNDMLRNNVSSRWYCPVC